MNQYDCLMIKKLRDRVDDLVPSDFSDFDFLRYLQEYDYNLDYIVEKLQEYVRLVGSYDFSNFQKNTVLEKYFPRGFVGVIGKGPEKKYHYIHIATMGTWDGCGFLRSVPGSHIYFHQMHCSEALFRAVRKNEKETGCQTDMIFIYDYEGLTFSQSTLNILSGSFLSLSKFLIKYYSVLAARIIIVNAPVLSNFIYNIFKPITTESVRKKVRILGSNWKKEILQYVDADALPVHYGGNLVDENGDPKFSTKIVYTTKIPSDLYMTPSNDNLDIDDFVIITIGPRKFKYISVEVTEVDSILEWFYWTENAWGFGIFFTECEHNTDHDKMEMVFPQIDHIGQRTYIMENDKIECKKKGFYKIWFNNSFSYISKLSIKYKIRLTAPSEQ